MATIRDRILLVLDVQAQSAQATFKKLGQDIKQAEGTLGKAKAGFSSLSSTLSANLAPAAIAAGGALVAFGVKSVKAFEQTALAAGKFSDATGVAVEDASRWMEVAGDIGVSTETIQSAFGKLNLALAKGTLKQYGIDATNASDAFIQVAEKMQATTDPAKRALLAQQAFGRGYQQVAELTSMSAEDLRSALDGVSDAKVIDEEEVAKARKLRAAMDDLSDTLEDIQLLVGEGLADNFTDLATALGGIADAVDKLPGDINLGELLFKGGISAGMDGVNALWHALPGVSEAADDVADSAENAGDAVESSGGQASDAAGDFADLAERIAGTKQTYDDLTGQLDDESAWLDLLDNLQSLQGELAAGGMSMLDAAQKTNKLKQDVLEYSQQVLQIPVARATNIIAAIDRGSLAQAEQMLAILTRNRQVSLSIQAKGGAGYEGGIAGARASGGPVGAGSTYRVVEHGAPEVYTDRTGRSYLIPGRDGIVQPMQQTNSDTGATRPQIVANFTLVGWDQQMVSRLRDELRKLEAQSR